MAMATMTVTPMTMATTRMVARCGSGRSHPTTAPTRALAPPEGRGKGEGWGGARGGIGDTVTCKGECHNLPN